MLLASHLTTHTLKCEKRTYVQSKACYIDKKLTPIRIYVLNHTVRRDAKFLHKVYPAYIYLVDEYGIP